jgi:hypothetical protein
MWRMRRNEAIAALQGQTEAIKALGATSLYLFGSTERDEAGGASDVDRPATASILSCVATLRLRRSGFSDLENFYKFSQALTVRLPVIRAKAELFCRGAGKRRFPLSRE